MDSSYTCPNPSNLRPYSVHATIDADNFTLNKVTIKSISETNVTTAIHGDWSGELGAKGGSDITDYKPTSINAGDKTTIKFTIAFECTNSGPTNETYADFTFKFKVVTSSGTFNLDGANKHRLQIQTG